MIKYRLPILALVLLNGCASSVPREGEWVPYERLGVQLRREIGMEPGQLVRACGNLINVGELRTAEELRPIQPGEERLEPVSIADGPSDFYDRYTGELVAACSYWECTRNARFCDRFCPPPGWSCSWEQP